MAATSAAQDAAFLKRKPTVHPSKVVCESAVVCPEQARSSDLSGRYGAASEFHATPKFLLRVNGLRFD
jgi:hypothetical protein